ncbi:MAG: hypothetical protein R3C11_28105 [Planctomycetaceae bacterium]
MKVKILPRLTHLDLRHTQLPDDFFTKPQQFPVLQQITLVSPATTNKTIEALSQIKSLNRINLGGDQHNDVTFKYSDNCAQLKILHIYSSSITQEAADEFSIAHPKVIIVLERDGANPDMIPQMERIFTVG